MTVLSSLRRILWPCSLAGKAFVIGLSMVLILAGAYGVAAKVASNRLDEALKLVELGGMPFGLQALYGTPLPPEKNAAIPLAESTQAAAKFFAKEDASRKGQEPQQIFEDPTFHAAAAAFVSDPKFEALLVDAENCPGYYSLQVPPAATVAFIPSHLNSFRDLNRVEMGATRQLTAQGKAEDACRRLLRLSRLIRKWESGEPQLLATLINLASRGLTFSEMNRFLRSGKILSSAMHDEIEAEIAKHEDVVRVFPNVVHMQMLGFVNDYGQISPLGMTPLARPFADNDKAYVVRMYHRLAMTAELPHFKARPELDAIEDDHRAKRMDQLGPNFHPSSYLLARHSVTFREPFDRVVAMSRCLRIVNAWARRGDFTLELGKLGLPAECLVDPFDGQQLRVKKTPNGAIVYTVHWDQKDDDGDMSQGADFGLGPVPAREKK